MFFFHWKSLKYPHVSRTKDIKLTFPSQKFDFIFFPFFHLSSLSLSLCSVCMNHGRKCVSLLHKSVEKRHFYRIYSRRPWKLWRGKFGEKDYFESFVCPLCFPPDLIVRAIVAKRKLLIRIHRHDNVVVVLNSCCLKKLFARLVSE